MRHRNPYVLPAGGSSPVGVLGYVETALELADQIERGDLPRPGTVVCAVGTGGTLAGTTLGLRLAGLGDIRVEGVIVNDQLPLTADVIARLAQKTAQLLADRGAGSPAARAAPTSEEVLVATDALGPGYGHPTPEGDAAVALGPDFDLPIEPVYTGKALGRVLRVRSTGGYGDEPVLFLQTNGPRA